MIMHAIWSIALNHLRGALNSRFVVIMTFAVPVIMIFFLGSALKFSAPTGQIIDVVRNPADTLASPFVDLLREGGSKKIQGQERYVVCDLAAPAEQSAACRLSDLQPSIDLTAYSKQRVDGAVAVALIRLPDTFTADLRSGKSQTITVSTSNDFSVRQAVQQEVAAVNARLGGAVLAAQVVTSRTNGDAAFFDRVYSAAQGVWAKDPILLEEVYSTTTGTEAGSGFGQTAPGIGAMFVMISALTLGAVFIEDRKQGTMQRMMAMPVSRAQILAGKLLGHYLLGVLTFGLMVVTGTILGVRWGDWLGVVAIVLAYTLAVNAMGLALSTLLRTGAQASALSMLITLILAPLGGAWWATTISPQWMQQLGKVSPIYWSQESFTRLIFYGAHLTDILPAVGVLLLFAGVFFVFGVSRYRFE
jgi:ABC-2 type transport system permease protein